MHPGEILFVDKLAVGQIKLLCHLEEFLILLFATSRNVRRLPLHVLRRLRAFHRRVEGGRPVPACNYYRFAVGIP